MSWRDRLTRYGSPSTETEIRPYIYMTAPEIIKTSKDVASQDRDTARSIEDLEKLIADLKEYRQALAARYAALETMSYKTVLKLDRCPHWQGRIEYVVKMEKTLEDGTTTTELCEVFPGKQRRDAIKRFEELKKQYPGIEAVKDIAKREWER